MGHRVSGSTGRAAEALGRRGEGERGRGGEGEREQWAEGSGQLAASKGDRENGRSGDREHKGGRSRLVNRSNGRLRKTGKSAGWLLLQECVRGTPRRTDRDCRGTCARGAPRRRQSCQSQSRGCSVSRARSRRADPGDGWPRARGAQNGAHSASPDRRAGRRQVAAGSDHETAEAKRSWSRSESWAFPTSSALTASSPILRSRAAIRGARSSSR